MTSRIVFLLGSSRSMRRRATVISSLPDASSAASISSSVLYLPVPRNRRERSVTPAMTRGSACVSVCTGPAYGRPLRRCAPPPHEWGGLVQVLLAEEGFVAAVGQALDGVFDCQPEQLVDLDARTEPAALDLHVPVAHDLVATAAVDVGGAAELTAQLAAQARLFSDFAQSAVLGLLIRLDLAFGQRPVVVCGTVDHCDFGFTRPGGAAHDSPRRPDDAHFDQVQDLCCHQCSFVS